MSSAASPTSKETLKLGASIANSMWNAKRCCRGCKAGGRVPLVERAEQPPRDSSSGSPGCVVPTTTRAQAEGAYSRVKMLRVR